MLRSGMEREAMALAAPAAMGVKDDAIFTDF
jgi:hypothetical protein